MSDLAAAAAAMGLPEALVERSAEARAAETGQSVEDLYAAWAGGEVAPAPAAPAEEPAASGEETAVEEEPAPEPPPPATPEVVVDVPETSAAPPEPVATGPYRPPVLVGAKDNPMTVLAGVIGLFVIVVMVGLVGPSIPEANPGALSSEIDYSDGALDGQQVYLTAGCASCHTQMVRPVVADVGLGPVTLSDTNQVLGTRRFGPDLADVGARVTASQIEAIIGGLGDHPALSLNSEDLGDLVAYLEQSATSPAPEEEGS
ncbi:MAG: cbb3-type cytochrome c oxidase subunit II [Acidimicrobiia bacterium]|jgi:mono/diheme cytochrome c family protein